MMTPPKAEKRPYPITVHGDTRVDDYYWLRDDDRADPQVLDYLQAENAFTDAALKPLPLGRKTTRCSFPHPIACTGDHYHFIVKTHETSSM